MVGEQGVILSRGGKSALFLPQVAREQGFDREQLLSALAEKAGLASNAWRAPDARFFVFTGQSFDER